MSKLLLNSIANSIGRNPDKIVVYTGVLGWVLSSLAQISAIAFNDKLKKEQKMFMIPQESADAVFNITSFFLITSTLTKLMGDLVKTGKWITKPVKDALIKNGLESRIGDPNFNILKDCNLQYKAKRAYLLHKAGMAVIAANIGSVISCNIVTPIFRNMYAAKRQEKSIAKLNSKKQPQTTYAYYKAPSMNAFINNSSLKI